MAFPSMKSVAGRFLGIDRDGFATGITGSKFPAFYVGTAGAENLLADSTGIKTKALYVGSTGAENLLADSSGVKVKTLYVGSSGAEVAQLGINAVQTATSATTATVLAFGGVITLSTAERTWSLAAPAPGRFVTIQRLTTSTATTGTVTLASGAIYSSTQIAATSMAFTMGGSITLYGISTGICSAAGYTTAANVILS